ncbi:MAG: recombinase RecA [Clostridia bacterium]|nr:recombinase RecA [Clostridia bacterium]
MAEKKKSGKALDRKSSAVSSEDKKKALAIALQQIEENYGKGAVMRLGDHSAMTMESIFTGSIALDMALGIGGLPRGRIIEVYGPEASGKTTLALHAIAEAQKAGGEAAYIDVEHALDPVYARALGVDVDALLVSQPEAGEDALEIAETLIRSGAIDIVVLDSVAALVPRAEIEGDMGDSHVGLQARLMSQAMRKLSPAVSQSKCIMLFINQLRQKVGVMYGNPEVTTGGNALKYYASVRMDVRRTETLKVAGNSIGSHTRVRIVKNKVAPPFKEVEFDIMYGEGISHEGEVLDLAVKLDIIKRAGAWFSYNDERIGQGRDNAKEYLKNNPEAMAEIEKKIRDTLGSKPAESKEAMPAPVEIPIADAPRMTAEMAKASIDIVVDDE